MNKLSWYLIPVRLERDNLPNTYSYKRKQQTGSYEILLFNFTYHDPTSMVKPSLARMVLEKTVFASSNKTE